MKTVTLDPNKIKFDGRGFQLVVQDGVQFRQKLERLREEFLKEHELEISETEKDGASNE